MRNTRPVIAAVAAVITLVSAGCGTTSGSPTLPATGGPGSSASGSVGSSVSISAAPSVSTAAPASSGVTPSGTAITLPSSLPSRSSSSAPSSTAATESLPSITIDSTSPAATKALATMNAALLQQKDLGAGFAKNPTYTPPDPRGPAYTLPCGQTSTAARFPNALRSGVQFNKAQDAQVVESATLFSDSATATADFEASAAGLNCSSGFSDGTPMTIGTAQDVTAQVGGRKALSWVIKIGQSQGLVIGVTSGRLTIGYTFLAAGGMDTTKLPNTFALAKIATARLVATGL